MMETLINKNIYEKIEYKFNNKYNIDFKYDYEVEIKKFRSVHSDFGDASVDFTLKYNGKRVISIKYGYSSFGNMAIIEANNKAVLDMFDIINDDHKYVIAQFIADYLHPRVDYYHNGNLGYDNYDCDFIINNAHPIMLSQEEFMNRLNYEEQRLSGVL